MTQTADAQTGRQVILDVTGPWRSPASLIRSAWDAREIVVTLAKREFFSRYRRTSLGAFWAVILPLVQAAVLAAVFTKVARVSLQGNAFVYVYTGLASWSFFSTTLGFAATSIVDNAQLASKIYFPRVALPVVAVLSNSYVAAINYLIAIVAIYVTGTSAHPGALAILAGFLLLILMTAALAILLSGLHVYFRDLRYAVQALLLVAFYLTPTFYPLAQAPHWLRVVDEINPVTGVIELTRVGTIGADHNWWISVVIAIAWVVGVLGATVALYSRHDRVFADLL